MALTIKDKDGNIVDHVKETWKHKVARASKAMEAKPDAKDKSVKYSRILNLPPVYKEKVDEMITSGFESTLIARTIQQEFGLHTDISEDGMRMYISRYRQEMVPLPDQMPVVGAHLVSNYSKKLFRDVELLEHMATVIEIQMNRINFDHEKEKKAKMSLTQNNNNVATCFKGMRDYGELAVKIGLLKKLGDELENRERDRPTALLDAALKNDNVRAMVHHALDNMLIDLEKKPGVVVDANYEESNGKE